MKSLATHMTVSFVTILFCVLYLYVGSNSSDVLRLDVSYNKKNQSSLFKLCNPTWTYVVFDDNLFFWDPTGAEARGIKLFFRNSDTDVDFWSVSDAYYKHTPTRPKIILPKMCMRKTYPLKDLEQEIKEFEEFKVAVKFYGKPKGEEDFSLIESEWFNP